MFSTANITIQFGPKPLFEDISVKFDEGMRYGLIGANGSGKSTLMKIMGGDLAPSSGNITLSENERLGKLRQDQFAFEAHKVIDTVIMGNERLWEVKAERERIYNLPEMSEEDGMKVADLEVEFGELDGYTAESSAGELLLGLEIEEAAHFGLMSEIAPGLKLRVLLAQALFSDPDILLLDEPTNNLDINTIRWLEDILNQRKSTMIIISHDRHFLNSVCTHMADLDYGKLNLYPGNYDEYMLAATQARASMLSNNAKKEAQIKELKAFVARFSANASKARQATSRAKQIDKIKLDDIKVSSRVNPYIRFEQEKKLHRHALQVEKLEQGHGDDASLFSDLNVMLEVGQRIAIIGPNGIGKTSFLETLVGNIEPRGGKIKWSENANIGYYAQDHAHEFERDITVFDWMSEHMQDGDDEQSVRSALGRMLFSKDDIIKKVGVLSGGEQGRMIFGRLMMHQHNILVMDEPTNHLDMESIESLNMALENFPGTLIFVSHDRQFVSSLATQIVDMEAEGISHFTGDYESYLQTQG